MRHLFVPACCLGLLTGGGVVGPEVSLAKLPDPIVQRAAPADIGADIDIDIDAAKPAPDESAQMQAEGAAVVASTVALALLSSAIASSWFMPPDPQG